MYHMARAAPRHPRPAPPSPAPDPGRGKSGLGRAGPGRTAGESGGGAPAVAEEFGVVPGRFWGARAALGAFPEQRRPQAKQDAEIPLTRSDATPGDPTPSSPPIRLRHPRRSRPLRALLPIPSTDRAYAAPPNGFPPIRAFPGSRGPSPSSLDPLVLDPPIFPQFPRFFPISRHSPQAPLSPFPTPTPSPGNTTSKCKRWRGHAVEATLLLPPGPTNGHKIAPKLASF